MLHDTPYPGAKREVIRAWGRDRLRVLGAPAAAARRCDVYLLGTGLPSFWVCRMGEMQLTLGLSGWTANDWTSGGSAIDQLAPPVEPPTDAMRGDRRRVPPIADLDARRPGGEDAGVCARGLRGAEQARAAGPGDPRPAARRLPLAAGDAGDALGGADRPGERGDGRGPRRWSAGRSRSLRDTTDAKGQRHGRGHRGGPGRGGIDAGRRRPHRRRASAAVRTSTPAASAKVRAGTCRPFATRCSGLFGGLIPWRGGSNVSRSDGVRLVRKSAAAGSVAPASQTQRTGL